MAELLPWRSTWETFVTDDGFSGEAVEDDSGDWYYEVLLWDETFTNFRQVCEDRADTCEDAKAKCASWVEAVRGRQRNG